MTEKTKEALIQIFGTKIGLVGVSFVLIVIFGTLGNWYDWCKNVMLILCIYPLIIGLLMIVFGLIINPIRALIEKINSKKKR